MELFFMLQVPFAFEFALGCRWSRPPTSMMRIAVPLTRLKEQYLEADGIRFVLADEVGNTVACRVTHEALRDHAHRMNLSATFLKNIVS
jgi:hypothetical protein